MGGRDRKKWSVVRGHGPVTERAGNRTLSALLAAAVVGWMAVAAQAAAAGKPGAAGAADKSSDTSSRADKPGGKDAYFLAEVLFRDRSGVLFLARDLISPTQRTVNAMPTVAFAADGKLLNPQGISTANGPEGLLPRLRAYWLSTDKKYAPVIGTGYASNDGTQQIFKLPAKEGEHVFVLWGDRVACRLERLPAADGKAFVAMPADKAFWSDRTQEISEELLVKDRERMLANPLELANVAVLFRNPGWLDPVRAELKKTGKLGPYRPTVDLCEAITQIGTADDFGLLARVLKANPKLGSGLSGPAAFMARRIGLAPARELLGQMLDCKEPADHLGPYVAPLVMRGKGRTSTIPEPLVCDQIAFELARQFRLDPASIGMVMAAEKLLAAGGATMSKKEKQDLEAVVKDRGGDWVMASTASRAEGIQKMKNWLDNETKLPRPAEKSKPLPPM